MFDIRRIEVHSVKDFVREYLMIVLGILTALGLEHLATERHHRHQAEEARQRIVTELRTNLAEVRTVQAQNLERMKPLKALGDELREDIRSSVSRQEVNRRVNAAAHGQLKVGFVLPTLRREAWDVVVANQSASYIEPDALLRYSAAYATLRDVSTLLQGATSLVNQPHMLDVFADLSLQRADPVDLVKVVGQILYTISAAQGNMRELQTALETSLAAEGETGAAPVTAPVTAPGPAPSTATPAAGG